MCFLQDTIEYMNLSVCCVCVCVYMCVCVSCMISVCEFYEKAFSQSFSEPKFLLSFYILAMTNMKMTIIKRRLATMS